MANPHVATPQEMFELVAGRNTTDPTWFEYGDVTLAPVDVLRILSDRVTPERRALFDQTLEERTDDVTVVVEGMVDLGNVGAVIRSADGFGVQSVHAIDTADAYKRSKRTSQGADKWVDRTRWEDSDACVDALEADGYAVVATLPEGHATPIHEADLTGRIAVLFGNELEGLSPGIVERAQSAVTIPMSGFSESFNISVAAAVTLFEVRRQRIARFGSSGNLPTVRKEEIRAVWYLKTVRESRLIVERALADGYRPEGT